MCANKLDVVYTVQFNRQFRHFKRNNWRETETTMLQISTPTMWYLNSESMNCAQSVRSLFAHINVRHYANKSATSCYSLLHPLSISINFSLRESRDECCGHGILAFYIGREVAIENKALEKIASLLHITCTRLEIFHLRVSISLHRGTHRPNVIDEICGWYRELVRTPHLYVPLDR